MQGYCFSYVVYLTGVFKCGFKKGTEYRDLNRESNYFPCMDGLQNT